MYTWMRKRVRRVRPYMKRKEDRYKSIHPSFLLFIPFLIFLSLSASKLLPAFKSKWVKKNESGRESVFETVWKWKERELSKMVRWKGYIESCQYRSCLSFDHPSPFYVLFPITHLILIQYLILSFLSIYFFTFYICKFTLILN